MSNNMADLTLPPGIDTPAKLAAWMDKKLKLLTTGLLPEVAERIRDESIDVMTQIALKWDNRATREEAKRDFDAYYRQVQAAVETSAHLDEVRTMAEADKSNPTVVGHMAKIVGDMNYTKASLLSSLLGGLGMERLAGSLDRLRTLEMIVAGLSGGDGIFSRIGSMLNLLDGKLTEMHIDTSPQGIAQQAGDAAQHLQMGGAMDALKNVLPAGITNVFEKFVSHPGAEEPDMPPALRKPPANTP